jgi:hypothetical protein
VREKFLSALFKFIDFIFMTDNNKIKFINGETFHNLVKLERATLSFNLCINEDFEEQTRISFLPQLVKNNCGFCEKIVDITNCEMLKEIKDMQLTYSDKLENFVKSVFEDQKTFMNQISEENKKLQHENLAMKAELKELKSKNSIESLNESENSNKTNLKLESGSSQTCDFVQNELKSLNMKLENQAKIFQDYIKTFQVSLEAKTSEISSKTAAIAKLEAELKASIDRSVLMENFQQKLEAQRSETFNAKIQELMSEVEKLKTQIEFCSKRPSC